MASLPDDPLLSAAIAILALGAAVRLWSLGRGVRAPLWTLARILAGLLVAPPARPASGPRPIPIPVPVSPTPMPGVPGTNFLETMSPEELERFLSEPAGD